MRAVFQFAGTAQTVLPRRSAVFRVAAQLRQDNPADVVKHQRVVNMLRHAADPLVLILPPQRRRRGQILNVIHDKKIKPAVFRDDSLHLLPDRLRRIDAGFRAANEQPFRVILRKLPHLP